LFTAFLQPYAITLLTHKSDAFTESNKPRFIPHHLQQLAQTGAQKSLAHTTMCVRAGISNATPNNRVV
jgi:hypothetical protein